MHIVVLIACLLLMAVGLAGTVVPVLPGIPIIWLGMMAYGWYTGWVAYGFTAMLVVAILVILSLAVDQLASAMGAKKFGASRAGMIGSIVGAIAGLLVFSLPGLIAGTFLGAMAFELAFSQRNLKESMASGAGALLGFLAGSLFKFAMGVSFIIYFLAAIIFS